MMVSPTREKSTCSGGWRLPLSALWFLFSFPSSSLACNILVIEVTEAWSAMTMVRKMCLSCSSPSVSKLNDRKSMIDVTGPTPVAQNTKHGLKMKRARGMQARDGPEYRIPPFLPRPSNNDEKIAHQCEQLVEIC